MNASKDGNPASGATLFSSTDPLYANDWSRPFDLACWVRWRLTKTATCELVGLAKWWGHGWRDGPGWQTPAASIVAMEHTTRQARRKSCTKCIAIAQELDCGYHR